METRTLRAESGPGTARNSAGSNSTTWSPGGIPMATYSEAELELMMVDLESDFVERKESAC